MEENDLIIEDGNISLDDVTNYSDEDPATQRLFRFVEERLVKRKQAAALTKSGGCNHIRNYRGIYGPDVQFTDSERSRVFIKVTKTKSLAAYGQIVDVLLLDKDSLYLSNQQHFLKVYLRLSHFDPQKPEGVDEGGGTEKSELSYGYKGDGSEVPKGARLRDVLGPLRSKLESVEKLEEGPGTTPHHKHSSPRLLPLRRWKRKLWIS
jgi:hypothetical protein